MEFNWDKCCLWHFRRLLFGLSNDIAAIFKDLEGRKTAILIENKIDALAQPNQAARYRSRGDAGIEKTWWHKYRTCMIAPQAYLDANSEAELYDARVSYESIKEWFQHVETDCRSAYRAEVGENAIEQNRRGYKPIPHVGVTHSPESTRTVQSVGKINGNPLVGGEWSRKF